MHGLLEPVTEFVSHCKESLGLSVAKLVHVMSPEVAFQR
jgi:hypothetical protein